MTLNFFRGTPILFYFADRGPYSIEKVHKWLRRLTVPAKGSQGLPVLLTPYDQQIGLRTYRDQQLLRLAFCSAISPPGSFQQTFHLSSLIPLGHKASITDSQIELPASQIFAIPCGPYTIEIICYLK